MSGEQANNKSLNFTLNNSFYDYFEMKIGIFLLAKCSNRYLLEILRASCIFQITEKYCSNTAFLVIKMCGILIATG